jgi:transglutaminase-like putative cysteine protease
MKFSISHELNYAYDSPVRSSTQYLRLCPRDTARQKVLEWKMETPGQAMRTTDGYGNILHVLTLDKPVSEIWIHVGGTVETSPTLDEPSDFTGIALSPLLFLRHTSLTRVDAELTALSEHFRRHAGTLPGLRELSAALLKRTTDAKSQALSHEFIACCRHLGVPARYISGYIYSARDADKATGLHAWAEAWVVDRWRSFDVAHGSPVGESHIKIAVGADYLDACAFRGVRTGGGTEKMVAQARVMAEPERRGAQQ